MKKLLASLAVLPLALLPSVAHAQSNYRTLTLTVCDSKVTAAEALFIYCDKQGATYIDKVKGAGCIFHSDDSQSCGYYRVEGDRLILRTERGMRDIPVYDVLKGAE